MAKQGFIEIEDKEPYLYRNPVTGRRHIAFRVRHNATRSPRLLAYRECVGEAMEGRRFRGQGPAQDEEEVHTAFREAAHACAQRQARGQ
jgi:hypothetical protein